MCELCTDEAVVCRADQLRNGDAVCDLFGKGRVVADAEGRWPIVTHVSTHGGVVTLVVARANGTATTFRLPQACAVAIRRVVLAEEHDPSHTQTTDSRSHQ